MEKVAEVLQSIAAQLGTTVENLWPYIVRQQIIEGWSGIITISILYLIFLVVFLAIRKKDGGVCGNNPNAYGVVKIVLGILTAILTLTTLCCIHVLISKIINPEYGALKDLMNMVHGYR